jgi:modulator of FtsH protease HflK
MDDFPHTPANTSPETPVDAGSQALSEALRSSFGIIKVVMVLLVLVFLGSGMFKVGPGERAIKLRMGRVVGQGQQALLEPGLHWSLPYPLEEFVKVSVTGIKKATSTVGWYATTPEQELAGNEPMPGPTLNPAVDGYVLTADDNIVHSRVTLTYHISDPVRFVFNFVNASNAVQSALDNALLYGAAHFKVDDMLTSDVFGFQDVVRRRVTALVQKQDLGITVEQCVVEKTVPPRQLKEAFASVLRAGQSQQKLLNEARGYENQATNRAAADADTRINIAKGDSARLVAEISGRADEFQKLLPRFRENPMLFVQKLRTERLGRVFTNAQDKIYVAEGAAGQPREVRLLFNRELPKAKTEEPKP